MIIACPECSGKLSTAAPSCPHCGYVQAPAAAPSPSAPASAPAPAPAPKSPPEPPPPELILPSDKAVRKAARRVWSEWVHSSTWRLFIGGVILLVALGLMFLAFLLALRINDGPARRAEIEKTSTP